MFFSINVKKTLLCLWTDFFAFPDNVYEVKLVKNSSGLGFSFSREDDVLSGQGDSSIVRVKKLFPGQPASECGKINIGDVILKVNGGTLKGRTQQVSCYVELSKPKPVHALQYLSKWDAKLAFWFFFILLGSCFSFEGNISRSNSLDVQTAKWYITRS